MGTFMEIQNVETVLDKIINSEKQHLVRLNGLSKKAEINYKNCLEVTRQREVVEKILRNTIRDLMGHIRGLTQENIKLKRIILKEGLSSKLHMKHLPTESIAPNKSISKGKKQKSLNNLLETSEIPISPL